MIVTQRPSDSALGFSITSPFKKVGRGIAKGARATGHVAKKYGVYAVAPVVALPLAIGKKLGSFALTPVRHRVERLKDRRAKKLAWDRRKSKEPNAAERAEAKAWTKSYLKGHPPHGTALALLAGAGPFDADPQVALLGEVVTAATVSASIPILIALMNHILGKANASGDAPAQPGEAPLPAADAAAAITNAAGDAANAAAADAGAEAGEDASADAGGGDGAAAGPKGKGSTIGGVPKKYVLIGAAVLGAVVLISLVKK